MRANPKRPEGYGHAGVTSNHPLSVIVGQALGASFRQARCGWHNSAMSILRQAVEDRARETVPALQYRLARPEEAEATRHFPNSIVQATIGKTTLRLVTGDIADQDTDAVVTAAHWRLNKGMGTDGTIHSKGGPAIYEECRRIGGCPIGDAVITTGGNLKARHVIHAVGPVWHGGNEDEPKLLASAYRRSLEVAVQNGLHSISFPSISTGAFGYPIQVAAPVALTAIIDFVRTHEHELEEVRMVLYTREDERAYTIFAQALEAVLIKIAVRTEIKTPGDSSKPEREAFEVLARQSGEVEVAGLDARIRSALYLLFLYDGSGLLAGISALKHPNKTYRSKVFREAQASVASEGYLLELGWVFVLPSHQGLHLSRPLVEHLLPYAGKQLIYATTREANRPMHHTLEHYGLRQNGVPYRSTRGDYNLVLFVQHGQGADTEARPS